MKFKIVKEPASINSDLSLDPIYSDCPSEVPKDAHIRIIKRVKKRIWRYLNASA